MTPARVKASVKEYARALVSSPHAKPTVEELDLLARLCDQLGCVRDAARVREWLAIIRSFRTGPTAGRPAATRRR